MSQRWQSSLNSPIPAQPHSQSDATYSTHRDCPFQSGSFALVAFTTLADGLAAVYNNDIDSSDSTLQNHGLNQLC
jgi:hypothetical protein